MIVRAGDLPPNAEAIARSTADVRHEAALLVDHQDFRWTEIPDPVLHDDPKEGLRGPVLQSVRDLVPRALIDEM